MPTFHLSSSDTSAKSLADIAFPDYNGRKYTLQVHDSSGMSLASCWDGGSRRYFTIVQLSTMKTLPVPQNGSGFDPYGHGIELQLPAPDFAVVEHSYFCGKDSGIRIHVHSENAAPLLPAATTELPWAERVVLTATRSLKSSYAGIKDFRFHEANRDTAISRAEWDAAKSSLISKKMLNAAGAITVDGRNSAGSKDLYWLGKERD